MIHQLTSLERLMLNAGQLQYPSPSIRAVALALTSCATSMSTDSARGSGIMPGVAIVADLADEFITQDPPLSASAIFRAYRWLGASRFLAMTQGYYRVDTTTLPMRCSEMDCADDSLPTQMESDLFGFGDH